MKRLNKRLIAAVLALIIAVSAVSGYFAYNAYAARGIDEYKSVSFRWFNDYRGIPETTIFIGTHLIALECATDELWEMAVNSQTNSGQNRVYYKSELAGGTWYDITDAESLMDITGGGTPVQVSDLANLRVMFYTFEYGKTYWANNGSRHCIFDGDYSYWDLYHLDEMQSVYDQWKMIDTIRDSEENEMDLRYRQYLNDLLRLNLRDYETDKATLNLQCLQDVYDALVDEDRLDDADIVYKLMAKLDNYRRSIIFKKLALDDGRADDWIYPDLDKDYRSILDESLQKCSGDGFDPEEEDFPFVVDSGVIDAIGTATRECISAYNEKSRNIIQVDGPRVIDGLIYDTSQEIIKEATTQIWQLIFTVFRFQLTPEMDENIVRLGHLMNIEDGKIVNIDEELEIIDNELMNPVAGKFQNGSMAGPNEDYMTSLNAGASDSVLSNILDRQEAEVDSMRLELQDVIRAKVDRMDGEDAMAFIYDRINQTEGMKENVPDTAFAPNGISEIQKHIDWLTKLLAELYEKYGGTNSELDNLNEEADALLEKQQVALDENDYRKAKEYEEARSVVLNKIDDITAQLTAKINDPNADSGEKALAKAILNNSNDGIDKLLQNILDDALSKQANGEDISSEVDLLTAFRHTDGLEQLGVPTDTDGGGGTGFGKGISSDDLLALLISIVGPIDSLSPVRLAECIRAMEVLYDMGYDGAGTLAARLVNIAAVKGNSYSNYVYGQIDDNAATETVALDTLSWVAGYRYAYDNSKRIGTLIGTGIRSTFQFNAGDNALYEAVYKETENPEFKERYVMNNRVRLYKNLLYADADIAVKSFNSLACHIKKSVYGICITNRMEGEAQTIVNQLLPLIEGTN